MKSIKFILISALLALMIASAACGDLLNQEPQGEWTEKDNKGGSFASVVFTLYAKARGFHVTSGNSALAVHSLRCEDIDKGSTASDGAAYKTQFEEFQYSPGMNAIGSYWTENYAIVHIVNKLLDDMQKQIESGSELTEGDMVNKAEAHFFRAYVYFNLVRAFGEVPLIDFAITDAAEANIPKSSIDKIYERIDADLSEASQFLPYEWPKQYIGRLTKGAANALHAKTYLQRSRFGEAYSKAMTVINSQIYNLNTPFNVIFRETGENCSESVLEWQCTSTPELPGSNDIGSQYAQMHGCRGAGDWNLGWGWFTPSQALHDAFENGDPRKDETLLYFYKTGGDASACPANTPYNEKPVSNADVTNQWYNKKAYTDPALRAKYAKSGHWFNIRMIRYSDVLLMAAESANEQGNSTEALDFLEQVRARARGGNNAVLPKVTTVDKNELRAAIKHERRVELAMEWDRFYDLVRWGDAQATLGAYGYQSKHQYLPLPQVEVDKSNGVLVQNPNY
jgi:hypothetical protein